MKTEEASRAWLLDFGKGLQAAVGFHEMSHVLTSPLLFEIPCAPSYCSEVLVFQEHILPVLDIPTLLGSQKMLHNTQEIVGIGVYQEDPSQPVGYGGLRLAAFPTPIYVNNEQACDLPEYQKYWFSPLVISCFLWEGIAIPIIDLAYLFSGKFAQQP